MRTMRFILSKDPAEHQVGDTTVSSLVMSIAAEGYRVRGVAFADDSSTAGRVDLDLVPRPPARLLSTAARSLTSRRSAVHTLYNSPALRRYLREDDSDLFVAEHSYMAESFLAVRPAEAGQRIFVNTHVSESDLFARSSSRLRRAEAPRLWRDELRVARSCRQLGCLDDAERSRYAAHGVPASEFLDLSMPPARRARELPPPNLVFLGAADWPPNAAAVRTLLTLWPRIRARAGAESRLLVAGKGMQAGAFPAVDGVDFLGFADDLDALFADARALVAPVTDGGGVRVKFLDAAARGLPVVGTPAAVGSLSRYLPVRGLTEDALVEECGRLLTDPAHYLSCSDALYEANRNRWLDGVPQASVHRWLQLEPTRLTGAAA